MSELRICMLGSQLPPDWQLAIGEADILRVDTPQGVPEDADVLLVDGSKDTAVADLRAAHVRARYAQPIVIATDEERPRVQRAITLSPGLGEVWVVRAPEVDLQVVRRAAELARQRRRFAASEAHRRTAVQQAPQPGPRRRPLPTDAVLAAVLQVARVAVFSLDDDGRILSLNNAAERLFAIRERTAPGRRLLDVVQPADPAMLASLLQNGGHQPDLIFIVEGEQRVFEIDVAAVRDPATRIKVVVAHDVTDLVRQREQLEEQAVELEHQADQLTQQATALEETVEARDVALAEVKKLMEARSRFYAAMNHEIRTPINAVLGFNDLLLAGVYGELTPAQADGIQRSQRAVSHLHDLVNDVLDLSKIEAGRVDIELEELELEPLIRDLLQTMEPAIMEGGSRVECDLQCNDSVCTDGRRLRQILMNLLSNAAKFGNGNPIRLRCSASDDWIRIDVIDRGIGIPDEQLPRIFDEFVQLRERRQRGTGLGLPISQRLATLLGGRLEVSSAVGEGSTFSVLLPNRKPG